MLKGFKAFLIRGNVVDLAIGVMIGAAFQSVVTSLVKDILTPFISTIVKQPNFSNYSITINGSQFQYGDFVNSAVSFVITAATIYFFIVLPINKLNERFKKPGPPPAEKTKKCPDCASEIPKEAKRCAFCTAWLVPDAERGMESKTADKK